MEIRNVPGQEKQTPLCYIFENSMEMPESPADS